MSSRAGLDKAAVVQAAAGLADTDGLEQLTLNQLAAHLGVRTPSLYNHIKGLEGLRRELALLGSQELSKRLTWATIGKASDEAVVALAYAYRAFAKEHPGLYAAVQRAPEAGDTALLTAAEDIVNVVLAVLAAYGLRDDAALHAVRGLRSSLHGFITLEASGGFGLPLNLEETFRRMVLVFIETLPLWGRL